MASILDKQTITLSEVIKKIDSGEVFSLIYVTADRRRGTGGELEAVRHWVKHNASPGLSPRGRGNGEPKSRIAARLYECNPNNHEHKTRNIINLKSRKIQKLHLKLIIEYNGKTVLL